MKNAFIENTFKKKAFKYYYYDYHLFILNKKKILNNDKPLYPRTDLYYSITPSSILFYDLLTSLFINPFITNNIS